MQFKKKYCQKFDRLFCVIDSLNLLVDIFLLENEFLRDWYVGLCCDISWLILIVSNKTWLDDRNLSPYYTKFHRLLLLTDDIINANSFNDFTNSVTNNPIDKHHSVNLHIVMILKFSNVFSTFSKKWWRVPFISFNNIINVALGIQCQIFVRRN